MEFREAAKSDVEVARSNAIAMTASNEASHASERAGVAEKQAGQARLTAANVESNNLELARQVSVLKAKLQHRRINTEQVNAFMFLTQNAHKNPIRIVVISRGEEERTFASDLRHMFTSAGFSASPGADETGVEFRQLELTRPFGSQVDSADVILISGDNRLLDENGVWIATMGHMTNGFSRPYFSEPGEFGLYSALRTCFQQIGITCDLDAQPNLAATNEAFFIVMPK
jgi:hypothetical protein